MNDEFEFELKLLGVGEVEVGAAGGKWDVTPPDDFKRLEVVADVKFAEVSDKFFCDEVSLLEAKLVEVADVEVFLFK